MLEQKDLQAIAALIDERAKKTETLLFGEMDKLIDEKIMASENRLRREMKEMKYGLSKEMNRRIGKSTSRIIKEMDKKIHRSASLKILEKKMSIA